MPSSFTGRRSAACGLPFVASHRIGTSVAMLDTDRAFSGGVNFLSKYTYPPPNDTTSETSNASATRFSLLMLNTPGC